MGKHLANIGITLTLERFLFWQAWRADCPPAYYCSRSHRCSLYHMHAGSPQNPHTRHQPCKRLAISFSWLQLAHRRMAVHAAAAAVHAALTPGWVAAQAADLCAAARPLQLSYCRSPPLVPPAQSGMCIQMAHMRTQAAPPCKT